MSKDFKTWHIEKSDIEESKFRVFFHEREVWMISIGLNIGFEQDGRGKEFLRPVLVFKKFNNETLWGIPLTSKQKVGKYYIKVEHGNRTSTTNLSQLRLVDSKRLKYQMGVISEIDFAEIKKRIIGLIA